MGFLFSGAISRYPFQVLITKAIFPSPRRSFYGRSSWAGKISF